jgi:hypothetical protein
VKTCQTYLQHSLPIVFLDRRETTIPGRANPDITGNGCSGAPWQLLRSKPRTFVAWIMPAPLTQDRMAKPVVRSFRVRHSINGEYRRCVIAPNTPARIVGSDSGRFRSSRTRLRIPTSWLVCISSARSCLPTAIVSKWPIFPGGFPRFTSVTHLTYSRCLLGAKSPNVFRAFAFFFKATLKSSGTAQGFFFLDCVRPGALDPASFNAVAFFT